jgi:endonuclease/exonuclease/phosphatase family metal-dependent hydrolase
MNFWQNTHIFDQKHDSFKSPSYKNNVEDVNIWINNCKKYIQELDADIILLQEINPFILFGEKYEKNDLNQYKIEKDNKIIIYHELYDELSSEKLEENFWGNSIIINSNIIISINNLMENNNNYYGRNSLMCYDIITKNEPLLTVINYYNKKNLNKKIYSMPYDIKSDLEDISKKSNREIIFAGDFNSDKDRDFNNRSFFSFLDKLGFSNITTGDEFINTMVSEVKPYPNDKALVKNIKKEIIKNINCKKLMDININISDHYPILIEIIKNDEIEINGKIYKDTDIFPDWYETIEELRKELLGHY